MNQSEDIKELVSALSKAQGKIQPAKFNKTNPHYKTRYADFTSVMDACRTALSDNGLAVMQYCETINNDLTLVTMLAHTSGQWIKSHYPLKPAQMTSQAIGACMTYAKRYSLSAMIGIVADDDDDDGETDRVQQNQASAPKPVKLASSDQIEEIKGYDSKLDSDTRAKIQKWLVEDQGVTSFDQINVNQYLVVKGKYLNAIKYMEQKAKETANASA